MWEDMLKNQIQVGRQKLRTDDQPLPDDEEEDCERRFWELWESLKLHMSFFKKRKPYWLSKTSLAIDITDSDYCAIIEYLKELDYVGIGGSGYEKDIGDSLNVWFFIDRYTSSLNNNKTKIRYTIEIYQKSPHPIFGIIIYDMNEFVEAIRRFA